MPSSPASSARLPSITLKPQGVKRLRRGHPWVYSNEVEMNAAAKAVPPGALVALRDPDGSYQGTAFFNRHPLIAARLLSEKRGATIDRDFIAMRLGRALEIRERLISTPYYRLIHAEADGLPGLIVDRFGDALAIQVNTAGMERLTETLIDALDQVIAPATIVLRNDGTVRALEHLPETVEIVKGRIDGPLALEENGTRFFADLQGGQKTGWFYDQRDNRVWAAGLSKNARVLDCYSFSGGFAVLCALAGAKTVTAVDRSQGALDLAAMAAEANGVSERCRFVKAEVFQELQRLAAAGERYELVIVDPPAFVKSKKDLAQGLKGYRKLARLAATLVAKGGYLVTASCSHHADVDSFAGQVRRGLQDAGRSGRILRTSGAAPDHPVHPALPESAYLKAQFLALD
ncbi:class I SAM-dependent rRNA methyltransferase [Pelagibius litoralis]|uniref:Class I SAM-dependent rRNA methyltransferase n=1 Tax=Pelagibius litoralis TaxID=374515 RepID=A0A967F1L0_9PROT|nr:class I SAM-dependent rRNA methyltransferase [Pelagibius litoralis]NIA71271.1 class I SAM-dependent rRNA methyltransferase [Pelagibius litoralis]